MTAIEVRDWRARIGIVLQTTDDIAELTVREMVRHVAGSTVIHGRPPR
ncbi:hypothetical protein [Actinoplanes solisilvae]|nr:hypothetical protein [Actinoplanes solisilvae]